MNEKTGNRWFAFIGYWIVLAISFGYCIWTLAATQDRVLPIFSIARLMMIHVLASLPLGYLLITQVRRRLKMPSFVFLLPAICTILLPFALESFSWALKQSDAGFLSRWFIRSFVSIAMVFGWGVTAPRSVGLELNRGWVWTLLLWSVLPTVYALKQTELSLNELDSSLSAMRLARAYVSLERAVEISGVKAVRAIPVDDLRRQLKLEIVQSEKRVSVPLGQDATLDAYLQKSMQLLTLSRFAEAEQVLLDSKSSNSQVSVFLALVAREMEDWNKVESRCRDALRHGQKNSEPANPIVYQMLGESLVGQRRIKEAISIYEVAITQCQAERGQFEMRLGTLFGEAGNHALAIEYFRRAKESEPKLAEEATKRVRSIQNNSCQL